MIHLPFIPLAIGALLETLGVHGALEWGMVACIATVAAGMVVMSWRISGAREPIKAIVLAAIVAIGVNAATTHANDQGMKKEIGR